jgi:hypothetical protein
VGRKAHWVSPRQPGRRNINHDIQRPAFFRPKSGYGSYMIKEIILHLVEITDNLKGEKV